MVLGRQFNLTRRKALPAEAKGQRNKIPEEKPVMFETVI